VNDAQKPADAYGTTPADAPVSRADFERGLRAVNIGVADLRDDLYRLAAQVVALTDELTRRMDGPAPAADAPPARSLDEVVDEATRPILDKIQSATEHTQSTNRLHIHPVDNKYDIAVDDGPPCEELLPLCEGRCCRLQFALSTQDLDEGVIRWDYGQPYLIRQRASDGYCVHNDPDTRGCDVHAARPRVCRVFDCRRDPRIWLDFERRIPAPEAALVHHRAGEANDSEFDLLERARARAVALRLERHAVHQGLAEPEPVRDPK
jgi:Fe-S-cluster containining protein